MARSRTIEVILSAVDRTKDAFRSLTNNISRAGEGVKNFAQQAGLAFGIGGGGSLAAVKAMADEMARLQNVAERLGTTTEELSKLSFAAKQTGVDAATLEDALNNLVVRIGEATEGTGEGYEALERLGLAAQDLLELAPEEQFLRLAEALENVGTQAERVQLVDQIFGDTAILQTLQLGREEIERLGEKLKELGGVVDTEVGAAAKRFSEQINILNARLKSVGITAANNVVPYLTFFASWANTGSLAQAFADADGRLENLPPRLRELQIEMEGLAGKIRALQQGALPFIPEDAREQLIAGLQSQLNAVRELWFKENKRITDQMNSQTRDAVERQETLESRLTAYMEEQQKQRVLSFEDYLSQIDALRKREQELLERIANAGQEILQGAEAIQIGPELDPGDLFIRLREALGALAGGDADAARQTIENITDAMDRLSEEGKLDIVTARQLRENLSALARDITEVEKQEIIDTAEDKKKVDELKQAIGEIREETGENGEPLFTNVIDEEQVRESAQQARAIIESELAGVRVTLVVDEGSVTQTRERIESGLDGIETQAEVTPTVSSGPRIVETVGEFGEPSFSHASAAQGHKTP